MSTPDTYTLTFSHGDEPVDATLIATDEEMQAVFEEIEAKNPDLEYVTYEYAGDASTIEQFKRDYEHLFEKP